MPKEKQEAEEAVAKNLKLHQAEYEKVAICEKCKTPLLLMYKTYKNYAVIYASDAKHNFTILIDFLHKDNDWKSSIDLNKSEEDSNRLLKMVR